MALNLGGLTLEENNEGLVLHMGEEDRGAGDFDLCLIGRLEDLSLIVLSAPTS